ncbi:MAG: ABC transporter permease [Candidatus Aminicenantes bacterium]
MRFALSLKISRKQLIAHKMRTFLALLGVIIGVSAVILMVSVGRGAQKTVLNRINEMGTNLLVVNAGQIRRFAGRKEIRGTATTLTLEDADAVLENCYSVNRVAPVQSKKMQVKYGNYSTNTTITGTTPDYQEVRNFRVEEGEFFSEEENTAGIRVAVLGRSVWKNLFEEEDPLGEIIRIGRVPFEVIGIMESKGVDLSGVDQDDQVFIPLRTAMRRVFNLTYINSINIEAVSKEKMDAASEEIQKLLRERHRLDRLDKPDDFTIQSQADLLEAEKETTETFTTLIGSIAAVSLLVGGIGILAIMLMAVKERTNEIGLRMSVGASRKDILVQFIFEAAILGLGGGTVGVLIGIAGSLFIGAATKWPAVVSWPSVAISFGFSLMVGLFFGVYPARRASLFDPIVALRNE